MTDILSDLVQLMSSAVPVIGAAALYIFFIVSSLAIARSRTSRLDDLVEVGFSGAYIAQHIVSKSEGYLLCTQVGRFLSALGAGYSLAMLVEGVSALFARQGLELGTTYAFSIVILIIVSFVVTTLVAVQVAKTVSLQFPEHCLCVVAFPLRAAYAVCGPIVGLIHSAVVGVLSRFGIRPSNEREMLVSADELGEIVKISSESGAIEKNEQELLEGVVELSEQVAREVMTPRKDVVWVKSSISTQDLIKVLTIEAVSRVLVCGSDLDEVRGVVLARDLLRFVGQSVEPVAWKSFIRPAFFVPNTKPVDELLVELREKGIHLAVVLDEHGGVDGIVTLEDLVEEIVGDIFDEFDSPQDQPLVAKRESDNALLVDGAVQISALAEEHSVNLPEGEYDTVGGFVMAHLGHLPHEGEQFAVAEFEFIILQVHRQAVVRVAIRPCSGSQGVAELAGEPLVANGAAVALPRAARSS
jgi:CBS domain containing-hemolysin-like protein